MLRKPCRLQTDGRTDGQGESSIPPSNFVGRRYNKVNPVYPPSNFVGRGYNDGILLIGPLGTNFTEILIKIHEFSFQKMHLKMSSRKWWPFCLCLKVSTH